MMDKSKMLESKSPKNLTTKELQQAFPVLHSGEYLEGPCEEIPKDAFACRCMLPIVSCTAIYADRMTEVQHAA